MRERRHGRRTPHARQLIAITLQPECGGHAAAGFSTSGHAARGEYFYGVADSGAVTPGHLLDTSMSGPAWLSGGSVGPEGSILCTLLIAITFPIVLRRR
ncbi:MAG TPA: hypothetical protein VJ901_21055 [Thermoanaerobaculia bacterium]|nr:hypothetical protein [Thermoanaerobaculia bacterium]